MFMPRNRDQRVTDELTRFHQTVDEDRRGAGDRLKIREMEHRLHNYVVIAVLVLLFIAFTFYLVTTNS